MEERNKHGRMLPLGDLARVNKSHRIALAYATKKREQAESVRMHQKFYSLGRRRNNHARVIPDNWNLG